MTVYTKPAVRKAWAEGATGADITDPGDTAVGAGWPSSTTPPARAYFNWLLNWAANGIRYFMQNGVALWDTLETYQIGGLARGSDGAIYASLANGNIGNDPTTVPASWGPPQVPQAAANDNTKKIASTAWATSMFVKLGAAISTLSGQISNGQILQGAVTQFQGALSIAWSQITGTKNADQLSGLAASTSGSANTIAARDSGGQITAARFVQTSSNPDTGVSIAGVGVFGTASGVVANGILKVTPVQLAAAFPNPGLMPGVVIAADPGTAPSGAGNVGKIFLYY